MKSLLIVAAVLLGTTVTYARIGETQVQIEARYGKSLKKAKPIAPATVANTYQKGDLGYFIGFVDDKAVYELVEAVESDGDFGEDKVDEKDITASLKANADGDWVESTDAKNKKLRHWTSADGKLIATYDAKHYQLLIESAEFAAQRAVKK